ncbi:MAG: choice-of-anchor B domain-containing protein [Flavobacteriales bacterium]|jgi:choice-of-anchor B domain-containing protein
MKKILLLITLSASIACTAQMPCVDGMAGPYPCENVDLVSVTPLGEIGGGENLNDIWGWTDPETGKEYAIIGRSNGTAFVDVTDGANPIYIGNLPSAIESNNLWRDVKVYDHYAVIVSEHTDHGMQIFDLNHLEDVVDAPAEFEADAHYTDFGKAHNVVVNEETGFAYGVGTSSFNGGLHIVDINDPLNPFLVGGYAEAGYTHDAQVVIYKGPDTEHVGKEIAFACNADIVAIIDCTDKTDCQLISSSSYADVQYVHQGWLTEDHRYMLVDDELDELYNGHALHTHMYDMLDLDDPFYMGYYDHGIFSSDHNQYIKGDFSFQSNYSSGLRILDVSDVANANLTLAAYFDIFPDFDEAGFAGSWSNYPYFESLNVILSTYDALFVLRPSDFIMVGVEEETAAAPIQIGVSPNPAGDFATLTIAGAKGKISLDIVDVQGGIVRSIDSMPVLGSQMQLDVSDLQTGVYILQVRGEVNASARLIKL